MDACTAAVWARRHFAKAELGDERRTRRLVRVATAFATGAGGDAGGTITSVIRDRHQAKAAYRLLDQEEVTHAAVISGHTTGVLEATAAPADYLLIEDTMAVGYPSLTATTGLGPIGEDFTRGLWVHSTLVLKMDWAKNEAQPLGLLGQRVWARPPEEPKSRGRGKKKDRASRERKAKESERWMTALEASGGAMAGTTWTYVADRESDIYGLYQCAFVNGWSFVVRAAQPRALGGPWKGQNLLTAAAEAPVRGRVEVELTRESRTAVMQVRSSGLLLRGPHRPGGRLADHQLNVVRVRELNPPSGREPVTWVLVTDLPVDTLEQCQRVIAIYRWRWLIEELHKAIKTGMKVEASQLSTARRIAALIGVLSVVAVSLLEHKLAARTDPQAPLQPDQADATLVAVLKKVDPPQGRPTRRWFWLAIAKLGGFQARPSDGDPGWLTLWRGWQTLMLLARGYDLANSS